MASLSPKGRALIQAGRRALRATPADRERVENALRARLGADALPPELPAAPLPRAGGWAFKAKVLTAVGLLGAALFVALAPRASTPVARPPVPARPQSQAVAAPAAASRSESPAQTDSVAAAASPAPASASVPPRRQDRLAQEVSLLSRATGELRAGRARSALRALDAHQKRFPTGILTEERRAAKAQALCLLGRVAEGRAELSQLAPQSPAAARASQVCAAAPARTNEP